MSTVVLRGDGSVAATGTDRWSRVGQGGTRSDAGIAREENPRSEPAPVLRLQALTTVAQVELDPLVALDSVVAAARDSRPRPPVTLPPLPPFVAPLPHLSTPVPTDGLTTPAVRTVPDDEEVEGADEDGHRPLGRNGHHTEREVGTAPRAVRAPCGSTTSTSTGHG